MSGYGRWLLSGEIVDNENGREWKTWRPSAERKESHQAVICDSAKRAAELGYYYSAVDDCDFRDERVMVEADDGSRSLWTAGMLSDGQVWSELVEEMQNVLKDKWGNRIRRFAVCERGVPARICGDIVFVGTVHEAAEIAVQSGFEAYDQIEVIRAKRFECLGVSLDHLQMASEACDKHAKEFEKAQRIIDGICQSISNGSLWVESNEDVDSDLVQDALDAVLGNTELR